ncbi:MAG: cytochrome c biogenesis protein CcdA [Methylobacterium mesophilicum]|nr:cytochrome c biogenesis protein CcdA [Methylobacterium mesophilicum]
MLEIANIGVPAALLAGMISFLSPCVLPLVPGYVSFIAGSSNRLGVRSKAGTAFVSLCFVLGFSTVFILLGASATAISGLLLSYRYEANIVGGAIIILFGIFMTGIVKLPWLERDLRYHGAIEGGKPTGAYVLGLAFGFGWTPCIGPILGAILTMSATVDGAMSGVALLSIYSLGLGLPFLATALFADVLTARLRKVRRLGRILHVAAGVVMILMGIAMITGQMSAFAFWLLERFPVFGRIG